jgi:large subunit ribosomal protein L25
MADNISISVQPRTSFGKKNRALRRAGIIPVHVYGQKEEPLSLQVELAELRPTLRAAGATTPVTVKVEGGGESVTLVREIKVHPVSGDVLHVDFMRVDVASEVQAVVPLTLINTEEAPGIRGGAGVVTQAVYEVTVRARPFDIPNEIEVDCTVLVDLEADIKASELVLPNNVHLESDPDARIAWIQPPRVIEEVEPVEGEEGAEGEGAEGDEDGDEGGASEGEQSGE